ncbi:site-specific integrase [Bacillus toyonensis]|uniref:tyrosine-type recombinase/integrase n=1 Tax=Bacillus toyonensis TaxID=155322 RepID=UPI000883D50B|nr:tyrosine-type recombinase/integrase [Bacillus toyonensis]KAB2387541.1 tyrosine-type recombinase/integrase [Bacillus toyonensis]PGB83764.1 site-specific integrase [Bacillus toyonensis]SDL19177.1 Phage integrase family protein [Bacillus toyonensis]
MQFVHPIKSIEDIQKMEKSLMCYCSYRDYFMFVFGIHTGLRISDILPLKVKDVKGQRHLLLIEDKSEKVKKVILNDALILVILEYIQDKHDDEWLFPSRNSNKHISRIQAYRTLNKAAQQVGIDKIGTHTLRKTFGYHYYQKTKDINSLMAFFNHSCQDVTRKYIDILEEESKDVDTFKKNIS